MECVECALLLRVLNEYKPGWISKDDERDKILYIGLEHGCHPADPDPPGIIRLLKGAPKLRLRYKNIPDVYEYTYDDLEVVDSFSYFRPAKG
jgi:hypothetical protein